MPMIKKEKAEFVSILLKDLKPFWEEIDIPSLISNIDWYLGYTFIYECNEEVLVNLIESKNWKYENREKYNPRIITKYYWKAKGEFFYIVLTKSLDLDSFQKKLQFEKPSATLTLGD